MLDTVILLMSQEDYRITNYEAFNPTARYLFEYPYYRLSKGYISCVQNPTKTELREGNYKPRLTLTKRIANGGYSINLKIEFSAPKLLFGNNFEELENLDFMPVVNKLQQRLQEMGVIISQEKLKNAQVTGIHYGKNVLLKNATSSLIIEEIRKLNVTKRLDTGNTSFRNEGQAVRFHSNSYELTFYDKMKDLAQAKISEKRAVEDDNYIQLNLFTQQEIIQKEVLRMEVRLNTYKKIKDILGKINYNKELSTFKDFFDKQIAKTILFHFWAKYVQVSINITLLAKENTAELFYKIKNIEEKDNKILQVIGALTIINQIGIRGFKDMVSSQSFYRVKALIDKIELDENYLYEVLKRVKIDLTGMESLKLEEYKKDDKILQV